MTSRQFGNVNEQAMGESAALEYVLDKLGQGNPVRRIRGYTMLGRSTAEQIMTPVPQLQDSDIRSILMQYEVSGQNVHKTTLKGDLVTGRFTEDLFNYGMTIRLGQILTIFGQSKQMTEIMGFIAESSHVIYKRELETRNQIWNRRGQL